jgi:ATP-dependent DNA helicase Q1
MPTGCGKSLTFQLPFLIDMKITIIIMPLISLIEDQIMAMAGLKLEAYNFSGKNTSYAKLNNIFMTKIISKNNN